MESEKMNNNTFTSKTPISGVLNPYLNSNNELNLKNFNTFHANFRNISPCTYNNSDNPHSQIHKDQNSTSNLFNNTEKSFGFEIDKNSVLVNKNQLHSFTHLDPTISSSHYPQDNLIKNNNLYVLNNKFMTNPIKKVQFANQQVYHLPISKSEIEENNLLYSTESTSKIYKTSSKNLNENVTTQSSCFTTFYLPALNLDNTHSDHISKWEPYTLPESYTIFSTKSNPMNSLDLFNNEFIQSNQKFSNSKLQTKNSIEFPSYNQSMKMENENVIQENENFNENKNFNQNIKSLTQLSNRIKYLNKKELKTAHLPIIDKSNQYSNLNYISRNNMRHKTTSAYNFNDYSLFKKCNYPYNNTSYSYPINENQNISSGSYKQLLDPTINGKEQNIHFNNYNEGQKENFSFYKTKIFCDKDKESVLKNENSKVYNTKKKVSESRYLINQNNSLINEIKNQQKFNKSKYLVRSKSNSGIYKDSYTYANESKNSEPNPLLLALSSSSNNIRSNTRNKTVPPPLKPNENYLSNSNSNNFSFESIDIKNLPTQNNLNCSIKSIIKSKPIYVKKSVNFDVINSSDQTNSLLNATNDISSKNLLFNSSPKQEEKNFNTSNRILDSYVSEELKYSTELNLNNIVDKNATLQFGPLLVKLHNKLSENCNCQFEVWEAEAFPNTRAFEFNENDTDSTSIDNFTNLLLASTENTDQSNTKQQNESFRFALKIFEDNANQINKKKYKELSILREGNILKNLDNQISKKIKVTKNDTLKDLLKNNLNPDKIMPIPHYLWFGKGINLITGNPVSGVAMEKISGQSLANVFSVFHKYNDIPTHLIFEIALKIVQSQRTIAQQIPNPIINWDTKPGNILLKFVRSVTSNRLHCRRAVIIDLGDALPGPEFWFPSRNLDNESPRYIICTKSHCTPECAMMIFLLASISRTNQFRIAWYGFDSAKKDFRYIKRKRLMHCWKDWIEHNYLRKIFTEDKSKDLVNTNQSEKISSPITNSNQENSYINPQLNSTSDIINSTKEEPLENSNKQNPEINNIESSNKKTQSSPTNINKNFNYFNQNETSSKNEDQAENSLDDFDINKFIGKGYWEVRFTTKSVIFSTGVILGQLFGGPNLLQVVNKDPVRVIDTLCEWGNYSNKNFLSGLDNLGPANLLPTSGPFSQDPWRQYVLTLLEGCLAFLPSNRWSFDELESYLLMFKSIALEEKI